MEENQKGDSSLNKLDCTLVRLNCEIEKYLLDKFDKLAAIDSRNRTSLIRYLVVKFIRESESR